MLTDKIIVVIGGSGLIGSKIIESISQVGGIVINADIANNNLQKISEKRPHNLFINVSVEKTINSLIDVVLCKYGRIDALVNASYPKNQKYGARFEELNYEDFCENVSLHLGGFFLVSKCFLNYFKKVEAGNLVNIASIYGSMIPRFALYDDTKMTMPIEYAATKSGIIQMTRYLASYFKGNGININSISPGGIYNGQEDSFTSRYNSYGNKKGLLNGYDVAGSVIFLLSKSGEFITGQNIIIDDGFSL